MNAENRQAHEFFDGLRKLYGKHLPFNRVLGVTVTSVDAGNGTMIFAAREDLIGNVFHRTLHGGAISAVMDAVGGLTASASLVNRAVDLCENEIREMLARVGTIDLRVDYLRPGKGERFVANGRIIRSGRKVAVVRMEMHNEEDVLVAVGTGTYMVG